MFLLFGTNGNQGDLYKKNRGYYKGPLYSDTKARFAGTCPKSRLSVLVKLRGTEVRPQSLKDR